MTTATDYFSLLQQDRTLTPDLAPLRRRFYALSQQWHPDRFPTGDADAQQTALEQTSQLNEALRVLSQPMTRLAHLLALEGHPLPEHAALSPQFMMEMMELNELAEEQPEAARQELNTLLEDWQATLSSLAQQYERGERTDALYAALQETYFRKKYLDRVLAAQEL
ncbi:MAG: hypothetical protein EOP52_10390 [Sphingobacteriales bacterium]|nr:MAG: hypothetical protein EOP52_10390 [Sphingobacteriales bacterium]